MSNRPLSEQWQAWRVVDANANRAAEGLRSLEDYARLVRQEAGVAAKLKQLRHDLTTALETLPRLERLQARSTFDDAGTNLTTDQEMHRPAVADIVPAACERITQSLRNLEEFSKPLSAAASSALKQLRYEAYDILAQSEIRLLTGQPLSSDQRLYLLVDCDLPLDEFQRSLKLLAAAGVDLFQVRDKQAEGGRLVQYARAGVEALRETSARLIVNDRIDVALASGAAGVHLGQEDIALRDACRLVTGRLWIGISTHNIEQARQAEREGADYIGCGPTFPSQTKRFDSFAGTQFLQQAAAHIGVPMFAIGGINLENLGDVMQTGCRRVAVSGAIHQAGDRAAAAKLLKDRLSAG